MEFLLSSSLSVSDDGIIRCVRSKAIEVLRARGAGGQVRRTPVLYGLGVLYNDSSMLQLQRNCLVSMIAQDVSKKIALALLIGLWLSFQSILWWQQQRWNRDQEQESTILILKAAWAAILGNRHDRRKERLSIVSTWLSY